MENQTPSQEQTFSVTQLIIGGVVVAIIAGGITYYVLHLVEKNKKDKDAKAAAAEASMRLAIQEEYRAKANQSLKTPLAISSDPAVQAVQLNLSKEMHDALLEKLKAS